jgi:hypothetical protein
MEWETKETDETGFKAKVVPEVVKGEKTISHLNSHRDVRSNQIGKWM